MIVWNEQKPDFVRRPLDDLVGQLPFPLACAVILATQRGPKVLVSRTVLGGIFDHLRERDVEMGGLSIGSVHELTDGSEDFSVAVTDFARSVEFDSTSVSLRMDPDVWERARLQSGDGSVVVGWYHSHPDLGVFFSGTDRKTQRAFFNHPHSLGLVVDPVRQQERWFMGADSAELAPSQIMRHS
jgi:proteasome lid subunit RPN8/RPN11